MTRNDLFSEEQHDYLVEMLNIGAGNATTALSHLLQCKVNMLMPGVDILPACEVPAVLGDPSGLAVGLRMKMVGDMVGCLFFLIPEDQKTKLAELAERAMLGPKPNNPDPDHILAALAEIANILAGVYLTAIHDFCKLNISHSVPVLAADMLEALLDETLATRSSEDQTIIVVKNEFLISDEKFQAFFLIFPSRGTLKALVDSMKEAGKMYGVQ